MKPGELPRIPLRRGPVYRRQTISSSRRFGAKTTAIAAEEFRSMIRGDVAVDIILNLYSERVSPFYEKSAQISFIRILMAKAKWFFEEREDIEANIRIWRFAHAQDISPDTNNRIIRTMLGVANKLSDRDIDGAINIWTAAYRMIDPREEKAAADIISNLWAFVRRYLASEDQRIIPAIKVLHAIYALHEDSATRESAISFIMDKAADSRDIRYKATRFFGLTNRHNLDATFHARLIGSLLYCDRDYQGVINFVDSIKRPATPLLALKAEALRKQRELDRAIKISNRLLKRLSGRSNLRPSEARALLASLCCRGHCRTERWRRNGNLKLLRGAVSDFRLAITRAEELGIPIPPQAHSGLKAAQKALGRA